MRYGEAVSGRDAAFFFLEGRTTPYHMAALGLVEGPLPPYDEVLDAVGPRLALLPRFRQRLAYPFGRGRPVWVEDSDLDLAFHVRTATVPAPGFERDLRGVVAVLMEAHLDRHRPLWELWVLDGLAGGDWAFLLKVHHSLVDGVGGIAVADALFDDRPHPRRPSGGGEPAAEHPPTPGGLQLAADVLLDRLIRPARLARDALRAGRHPARLARTALTLAAAVESLVEAGVRPAPRVPCNGLIGPNRTFELAEVPLQDLKDVKNALGGTVNDVVLAVVSGGLRSWLLARGLEIDGLGMKALVPISMRRPGADVRQGNLVAGVIAPLPVGEPDPAERLRIVRDATARAKGSSQAAGTAMLLELPSLLPAALTRGVAAAQRVQRFFNLSMTNVRGSEGPLYVAGRRIRSFVPVPPLSANAGLIVGAMSYDGAMTFGLLADPVLVPDLAVIAEGIEKSAAELLHVAAEGGSP